MSADLAQTMSGNAVASSGLLERFWRGRTKYLVGADGKLIGYWPTKTKPDDPELVAAIERALP